MTGRIKFSALIFFFLIHSLALAQDMSVNVEPDSGISSDSFMLSITVKNSRTGRSTPPRLKESKEFIVTSSGTSTQTEIMNGTISNEVSYNYELSPREGLPAGQYQTPEGTFNIDGELVLIPARKITILDAPKEQNQQVARIKINQFTDKEIAYVGEQITYTVQVISGDDFLGGNLEDIEVLGFWREKLGNQEKKVFQAGSKTITTFQEVLIPNRSGDVEIKARKLSAQMQGPARQIGGGLSSVFNSNPFFKGFLRSTQMLAHTQVNREFSTQPVKIKVKPLPPTKLTGYMPVGQLNLKFSYDKEQIKKGESINLKLRLSGFANLRPLEIQKPAGVEDSFKIYIDPAETNVDYQKARVRFTKIFNIALVPTHSGELTIPEFKINYFDPLAEEYKTLSTESKTLTVEGNFDDRVEIEKENQPEQVQETNSETALLLDKTQNLDIAISAKLAISIIIVSIFASFILFFRRKTKKISLTESALILALNDLENKLDYSIILKSFIGRKINQNLMPRTLKEIQVQYLDKIKDETVVNKGKEIVTLLDNILYNPNQIIPNNFNVTFIEFIKTLDSKI